MPFNTAAAFINMYSVLLNEDTVGGYDITIPSGIKRYRLGITTLGKIGTKLKVTADSDAFGIWNVYGEAYGKGGDAGNGRIRWKNISPFDDVEIWGGGGGGAGYPVGEAEIWTHTPTLPAPAPASIQLPVPADRIGQPGTLTTGGLASTNSDHYDWGVDTGVLESEVQNESNQDWYNEDFMPFSLGLLQTQYARDGNDAVEVNHDIDVTIHATGIIAGGGGGGGGTQVLTTSQYIPSWLARRGGNLAQNGYEIVPGDSDAPIIAGFFSLYTVGYGGKAIAAAEGSTPTITTTVLPGGQLIGDVD